MKELNKQDVNAVSGGCYKEISEFYSKISEPVNWLATNGPKSIPDISRYFSAFFPTSNNK